MPGIFILNSFKLLYFSSVNFVFSCLIIFHLCPSTNSSIAQCNRFIHFHHIVVHLANVDNCTTTVGLPTQPLPGMFIVHLDLQQYFHLQWYKEYIEALLPAPLLPIAITILRAPHWHLIYRAIISNLTSSGRLAARSSAAWTFSPWTSARDSSSVATSS